MANLNGQNVASNYKGIVNLQNLNEGVGLTMVPLQDGEGNNLPITVNKEATVGNPDNGLFIETVGRNCLIGSYESYSNGLLSSFFGLRSECIEGKIYIGDEWYYTNMGLEFIMAEQRIHGRYNGQPNGLVLDFAQNFFFLGSPDTLNNAGFSADLNSYLFLMGDVGNNNTGIFISVDSANGKLETFANGGLNKGLNFDVNTNTFLIGCVGAGNSTNIGIDDSNQTILGSVNLLANSAGATSDKFLKIKIGATEYRIQLLNA